jgi:hypothetical protein
LTSSGAATAAPRAAAGVAAARSKIPATGVGARTGAPLLLPFLLRLPPELELSPPEEADLGEATCPAYRACPAFRLLHASRKAPQGEGTSVH